MASSELAEEDPKRLKTEVDSESGLDASSEPADTPVDKS